MDMVVMLFVMNYLQEQLNTGLEELLFHWVIRECRPCSFNMQSVEPCRAVSVSV